MVRSALEPLDFPFFDYRRYTYSLGVVAGDIAFLSGHTASQHLPEVDRIVVEGNIHQQREMADQKILKILSAGGMNAANLGAVTNYVTPSGLSQLSSIAANAADGALSVACSSTVVVDRLLRPKAEIEVEAVASLEKPRPVRHPVTGKSVGVWLGDLMLLSSVLPVDESGAVIAEGDLAGQTKYVLSSIERIIAGAGLGMENIVKTIDYVAVDALPSYRDTAAIRREVLPMPFPAATGIPVQLNSHPKALIQIAAVACAKSPEAVGSSWGRYSRLTYSPAVFAGDYLFCSGQFAVDGLTFESKFPGDIVAQTKFVYESILSLLERVGLSESAVIKTVEYVAAAGLPGYGATRSIREELFSTPYPAATGVVVPRLLRPEMLIEVDCLAFRGSLGN
jgi:enamine deaminase RidA (YjgF/YER057c/UK114 family)